MLGRDLARPREGLLVGRPAAQELLGLGRDEVRRRRPPSARCPTSVIRPPASQTAAPAAPIGQSPARRATFRYALPLSGLIGSLISVSISAGPTTVSYGPV